MQFLRSTWSETCYTNDERIRALEVENRNLRELVFKLQDQVFSVKNAPASPMSEESGLALTLLDHPFFHDIQLGGSGVFEQNIQVSHFTSKCKFVFNKNIFAHWFWLYQPRKTLRVIRC